MAKYYKRFKRDFPLGDLPRSGWPPTLQRRHFDFIDQKLEENDELTSVGSKNQMLRTTLFDHNACSDFKYTGVKP